MWVGQKVQAMPRQTFVDCLQLLPVFVGRRSFIANKRRFSRLDWKQFQMPTWFELVEVYSLLTSLLPPRLKTI